MSNECGDGGFYFRGAIPRAEECKQGWPLAGWGAAVDFLKEFLGVGIEATPGEACWGFAEDLAGRVLGGDLGLEGAVFAYAGIEERKAPTLGPGGGMFPRVNREVAIPQDNFVSAFGSHVLLVCESNPRAYDEFLL